MGVTLKQAEPDLLVRFSHLDRHWSRHEAELLPEMMKHDSGNSAPFRPL